MITKKGEVITGEDFQTEEDRQMRNALEVSMGKEGRRFSKESSFKLNVDF